MRLFYDLSTFSNLTATATPQTAVVISSVFYILTH